ncbi:MAG: hypothetical protein AB8G15_11805 [Saprospiraceae bacterium]
MSDLNNLKRKVQHYKEILTNTVQYRKVWESTLRDEIVSQLETICQEIKLTVTIELKEDIENLETIILSLGSVKSGLFQKVNDTIQRDLIKSSGSLIYQQLFNGKIAVMINLPFIEGYGEPRPPKNIAIYRPEEIENPFIIRHLEALLKEVTLWEDYDDDDQQVQKRIGYRSTGIENPEQ